jgi:DNA-binding Lrp family transcriptional regulator
MTEKTIIDALDRKLLDALDRNARTPLSQIAKKLRIGKSVALYRYNRLRETGIIKGSFAEINTAGIGYHSFRVLLKLGNCTPAQLALLEKSLLPRKEIIWLSRVLGPWDVDFLFCTKEVSSFDAFRRAFFTAHNNIIEAYDIGWLVDIYSYPKDFIIGRERTNATPRHFTAVAHEIDEHDEQIMRLLSTDAMMPMIELAKRAKLSTNTVKARMRILERSGIILSYRLYLDTNKLGYDYFKLHLRLRHYNATDLRSLRGFLERDPAMVYTDHYLNGDDFEIELQLPDERAYAAFLDKLLATHGHIIKEHTLMKFYDEKIFRFLPEE